MGSLKKTDFTNIDAVDNWELKNSDDDEGDKNVSNKVNACCFKLHRSYIPCSSCQMLVSFSEVEFQRTVFKFRNENRCLVFT